MDEATDLLRERDRRPTAPDSDLRKRTSGDAPATDPEVIAGEIEQTRQEMSGTIDAIQRRIDPEQLSEQAVSTASEITVQARDAAIDVAKYAIDEAKTAVRELADQASGVVRASTVGRVEQMAMTTRANADEMRSDLVTLIRQNPVPAALAAVGIGWLWMERSKASANPSGQLGYDFYPEARRGDRRAVDQVMGQAQQIAGDVVDQAQQKTGQVMGQAESTAAQVQDRALTAVEGVSADPLAVGIAGAVLGAVAALMIPETERERELMGDARNQLIDRVGEMGSETVQKVQQVASEARQAAMREAEAQGLRQPNADTSSPV